MASSASSRFPAIIHCSALRKRHENLYLGEISLGTAVGVIFMILLREVAISYCNEGLLSPLALGMPILDLKQPSQVVRGIEGIHHDWPIMVLKLDAIFKVVVNPVNI